jgi:hypothetical protein
VTTPNFDALIEGLTQTGLTSLQKHLGDAWDSLTPIERDESQSLLRMVAETKLKELGGVDVSSYLPILDDALLQWKAVASEELSEAMRKTLKDILSFAGTFAGSLLVGFVKGLV